MGRKQKDIVFGGDTLLKVQNAWKTYQDRTQQSQAAAAHSISMNQSAFSQYLRGHIGLNTEFLIRFSRMVGIEPGFFSVLLVDYDEAAKTAGAKGIQVKHLGSLLADTTPFQKVVLANNALEARETKTRIGNIPAGSTLLLAAQGSAIHEGDVCLVREDDSAFVGELQLVDGRWNAVLSDFGVTTIKKLSPSASISRLEGIILPTSPKARKYGS